MPVDDSLDACIDGASSKTYWRLPPNSSVNFGAGFVPGAARLFVQEGVYPIVIRN